SLSLSASRMSCGTTGFIGVGRRENAVSVERKDRTASSLIGVEWGCVDKVEGRGREGEGVVGERCMMGLIGEQTQRTHKRRGREGWQCIQTHTYTNIHTNHTTHTS